MGLKGEISSEEKISNLINMIGGLHGVLYKIYKESNEDVKKRVIKAVAEYLLTLDSILDDFGLSRDPEGVAKMMVYTEDIIDCQPKGKLLSVTADEAVRKVTSCPLAKLHSDDGGTCRLIFAALEEELGKKYGLEVVCDQNLAEGKEYCIWKVRRSPKREKE